MLNYDNIQHMQFFLFKLYLQTSKNSYNCIQKTNCMRIIGFQSNSEGKMGKTLAYKILENHLVEGKLIPGEEIKIKVDQTLTQDSTGTMVYLQLEALDIEKVKTELSVAYYEIPIPDDSDLLGESIGGMKFWNKTRCIIANLLNRPEATNFS